MSTSHQGLPAGLRQATVTGFAWKALAELVVQLTRIVILVLLARILSPHDFGVAGIVLAFGVLIPVLSDMALGAALIHLRTLDAAHKATVFWSTVVLGSAFTGIGIALSWPIADAFGDPELQPLFAAFCFALLFASLASTPLALLTREMNFRALELRQMTSTLLGGAAGVSIAVAGGGAWALIGQYLVTSGSSLALMWLLCGYKPTRDFSFPVLRRLAGYSSGIFGASLLSQFGPSSQTLLAGRLLGTRPLGELLLAQQLVMLPFNRIAAPIQEVLFSAFSRMQDEPARIAVAWGRANQLVGAIAIPGLVGVALVAPEFVAVVFGDRWSELDILLRVLAIVGIVQALQRLNFSILQARAGQRRCCGCLPSE